MASGRPSRRRHSCAIWLCFLGSRLRRTGCGAALHEQGDRDRVVAQRRNGHDDLAVELEVLTTRRQNTRPPARAVARSPRRRHRSRARSCRRRSTRRSHRVPARSAASPGAVTPSARATAATTPSASSTVAKSANTICSTRPVRRLAASIAADVLPIPPGPTSVTSRCSIESSVDPTRGGRPSRAATCAAPGSSTTVGPARSGGNCPGPICTMVCSRSSPFSRNSPSGRRSTSLGSSAAVAAEHRICPPWPASMIRAT